MPLSGVWWLECSGCDDHSPAFTREDALLIRVTALGWEIPYVESLDELRRAYVLCPECRERKHDHSHEEKEARNS